MYDDHIYYNHHQNNTNEVNFCKIYWKEWCTLLRHMAITINQIERKRDFNDIPINICALRARYGVSNRIVSNRNIYQLIESIKFH